MRGVLLGNNTGSKCHMMRDYAEDTFFISWPAWLRWLLFIPAAAVGAMVAAILYGLINLFSPAAADGLWFDLVQSAILGAASVYLGAMVAPKYQFGIAILVLIVVTLIAFMAFIGGAQNTEIPYWQTGLSCLAMILGGALVVYNFYSEDVQSR